MSIVGVVRPSVKVIAPVAPSGLFDLSGLDLGPVSPARTFNESRARDTRAEDAAWWLAYSLTVEGVEAVPDRELPVPQRVAFLNGWAAGERQRDADLAYEAERWELLDRGCGGGWVPDAEYDEMRMVRT